MKIQLRLPPLVRNARVVLSDGQEIAGSDIVCIEVEPHFVDPRGRTTFVVGQALSDRGERTDSFHLEAAGSNGRIYKRTADAGDDGSPHSVTASIDRSMKDEQ